MNEKMRFLDHRRIQDKIYTIRGKEEFHFQLTREAYDILRSQFATSKISQKKQHGGEDIYLMFLQNRVYLCCMIQTHGLMKMDTFF